MTTLVGLQERIPYHFNGRYNCMKLFLSRDEGVGPRSLSIILGNYEHSRFANIAIFPVHVLVDNTDIPTLFTTSVH